MALDIHKTILYPHKKLETSNYKNKQNEEHETEYVKSPKVFTSLEQEEELPRPRPRGRKL